MNLTSGDILKIQGYNAPGVVDLDENNEGENLQARWDGCRGGGQNAVVGESGGKIADQDKIIVEEVSTRMSYSVIKISVHLHSDNFFLQRPRRSKALYQPKVEIKKPRKRSIKAPPCGATPSKKIPSAWTH